MNSNDHDTDFAKAKGPVQACRMCKNAGKPLPFRLYCKFCLTSGYVHLCLPCAGSGIVGAQDAWGGKSVHKSTCNACGGTGMIPAREPKPEELAAMEAAASSVPALVAGEAKMPENAVDGTEIIEQPKESTDGAQSPRPEAVAV